MTLPNEAITLYLAIEIYLSELDHLRAPAILDHAQLDGWEKAIAHVRTLSAEAQLRAHAHQLLPFVRGAKLPREALRDAFNAALARTGERCGSSRDSTSQTAAVVGSSVVHDAAQAGCQERGRVWQRRQ